VGWIGSLVLAIMFVFAFFPATVAPYDATERVGLPLQKPSEENILGTTIWGRTCSAS
jgi:ABC-type dipeptide/oligopeptide/nickel transport system permease subunit